MRTAALEYLSYQWSFIPIGHPANGADGKRPTLSEWGVYSSRLPTEDEVSLWFGGKLANIAIICGQVSHGLTIIDCDDPATYAALCYIYPELRTSRTVRTGKGFHIYTYAPEPVRTSSFELNGFRHHIKGEASYCVAPPSVHASGRTYEWVDPDAAPLILDLVRLRKALARIGAEHREPDGQRKPPGFYANLIRDGARSGERDELTHRLACHLLAFDGSLPFGDVVELMTLWAERCDQPWTRADIEAKCASAQRALSRLTANQPTR